MRKGKFFVSTGEILLPFFTINGKKSEQPTKIASSGKTKIVLSADSTFTLNFAEVVSGDGKKVYRERISLNHTTAFGKNKFEYRQFKRPEMGKG